MMKLILASTSPYRRALMEHILPPSQWEAVSPSFEERDVDHLFDPADPQAHAKRLAVGKAESVAHLHPGTWVLACDEVIVHRGEMLHKPGSQRAAVKQLSSMMGCTLTIVTGYCVGLLAPLTGSFMVHAYAETSEVAVAQRPLPEVVSYIQECRPLDCVGSFRMSDTFPQEILSWEGDPTNLQGFPVLAIRDTLQERGFKVLPTPDLASWYRRR